MNTNKTKDKKLFPFSEISKHNRADDCWLVIRGKVYDVTKYVPKHPGGNMIFMSAGLDSTYLFESYHKEKVKAILEQFYIGDAEDSAPFSAKYSDEDKEREIYEDLKKRVTSYFKENKINPRFSWEMYAKSSIILLGVLASFIYSFFVTLPHFWMSCLCAMLLGFFTAEVGVSIQHDANHGAYSKNPFINKWMGITLDLVGGSSFIWKQQHGLGHHVYTNIEQLDPDIRVNDPDVRRVTHYQPWQKYQIFQHLYLGILYGALAIKSIFIDDVQILLRKSVGSCPINHIHLDEKIVFWGFKSFYLFYYIILPLVFGSHGVLDLIKLWLIAQLTTGWILALLFQVNHVTEDAEFYEAQKNGDIPYGWLKTQVEGTTDFAHDSWFWTHISGGLNYQVVHHLFPWICHVHYPKIAPIVKDVCLKHGMRYVVYPSLFSALKAHFSHMKKIGSGKKMN